MLKQNIISKGFNSLMKNNNSAVSAVWYIAGTFMVQGINFLMTPIFTNLMSVENFGMLSICTMWVTVFSVFVTLQVHGSINNALLTYGQEKINQYVSSIQCIEIIAFSIIFILGVVFKTPLATIIQVPETIFLALLLTSFFNSSIQLMLSQLVAEKKHKQYFALSLILSVLSAAFSILLVFLWDKQTNYHGKIYGTLIGTILVGVFVLIYVFLKGRTLLKKQYVKYCLILTIPLIFHALSQIILGQSNRYMMKILLTDGEFNVGIYSYAHTLGAIINVLWLAMNHAWVPWYYDKSKEKNYGNIKKIFKLYGFVFSVLTVCFLFVSPELVKLMAPKAYWGGIDLIPPIAIGFFFMFLYSFPVNYEFYKQKTLWISLGTVFTALLNIGLNFFLIPRYEAMGAAVSSLIAYIFLFVFHFLIAKLVIKNYELSFWDISKYIIPIIIASIIYYLFKDLLVLRWALCLGLVISCAIYLYKKLLTNKNK